MTRATTTKGGVVALSCLGALLLAGCGAVGDDGIGGDGTGSEPITSRGVAAVALTHLPDDPSSLAATYVSYSMAPGTRGADLRYDAGPGEDGDLVQVEVSPIDRLHPTAACLSDAAVTCEETRVGDEVVQLRWEVEAPEEDPGLVRVTMVRDDEVVEALSSGPAITGDPRDLDLDISVDDLTAVVEDPRISVLTDRAVIEAGADLEGWQGDEPPDTADPTPVPATARALAGFFAQYAGVDYLDVPEEARDVERLFGPGAVAGRMTRVTYGERPPYDEVVVVASPQPPASWGGTDLCAAYERTAAQAGCRDLGSGKYLLWTPGRGGEVWVYARRADEVVGFRLSGFSVPEDAAAVAKAVGLDRLRELLDDDTRLGLTTTQGMANVQF